MMLFAARLKTCPDTNKKSKANAAALEPPHFTEYKSPLV
jgi:hypothetical protein